MITTTKLAKHLDEKGLNRSRLIEISGYSRKTVYTYLNGKVAPPGDFKKRVADYLEKRVEELF